MPSGFHDDPRALLHDLFDAAVRRAQPAVCVPPHLPPPPRGRLLVLGFGKASAEMARVVEQHYGPAVALHGLVVTRYGHAAPCRRIEIVEAAHPVPDAASAAAAARMLQLAEQAGPDDLVLVLVSGGGSSLLVAPGAGLTLADKQALNRALLASGASITEMNTVRRHVSAIKGGRLAAACHPARVLTLLMSDVPRDAPVDIASGPTIADPTDCADALAVIERYRLDVPAAVRRLLESGEGESIKPADPRLHGHEVRLVVTPQQALEAAAEAARARGLAAHILSDSLEGEARDVGKVLAGIARQVALHGQPFAPPCVLLSGGETTVTLRGDVDGAHGRGGRNVEFLLSFTIALEGLAGVHALAADTDGVDGAEPIAGAVSGPDTLARAWACGVPPRQSLDRNDAHGFFGALGDSVVTGPTLTNVNDFRAVLVVDQGARLEQQVMTRPGG